MSKSAIELPNKLLDDYLCHSRHGDSALRPIRSAWYNLAVAAT